MEPVVEHETREKKKRVVEPKTPAENVTYKFCDMLYKQLRKEDWVGLLDLFSFQLIANYDQSEWGPEEKNLFLALERTFGQFIEEYPTTE